MNLESQDVIGLIDYISRILSPLRLPVPPPPQLGSKELARQYSTHFRLTQATRVLLETLAYGTTRCQEARLESFLRSPGRAVAHAANGAPSLPSPPRRRETISREMEYTHLSIEKDSARR